MKPVPILLCAAGATVLLLAGASQYADRKVTLSVYSEPVTFFSEEKQGITLASLPAGTTLSAESCARCHQKEYAEWKASAHSRSVTEPVFASAFKSEPRFLCRSCHSPLMEQQPKVLLQADKNPHILLNGRQILPGGFRPHLTEANPRYSKALAAEGVTCVTCHVREGTILTANPQARASVPHPLSYAPVMAKAEYCAGCHQFDISNPSAHPFERPAARQRLLFGKVVPAVMQQSVHGAMMAQAPEAAPTEKPQAQNEPKADADDPVQPKPQGPETPPDAPPVPPSPGLEGQYHQEARVQHTFEEFRISPAALKGETCQSCHMPRREGGSAHSWPGRNELAMLQKAVSMTARTDKPTYRAGEKLQAVIHIKNDAGHRFPTGDSLHAGILDVWLCDGAKTLGRQTFLMASQGGGMAGGNVFFDGRMFRQFQTQVFRNLDGTIASSDAFAVLDAPSRGDTRLLPGEDALFVYHQPVTPQIAQAKNLTLRVRIFHSAVHPGLKRSSVDPGMNTMRLVRELTLPVRVNPAPAPPPAETALRTVRRAPRG